MHRLFEPCCFVGVTCLHRVVCAAGVKQQQQHNAAIAAKLQFWYVAFNSTQTSVRSPLSFHPYTAVCVRACMCCVSVSCVQLVEALVKFGFFSAAIPPVPLEQLVHVCSFEAAATSGGVASSMYGHTPPPSETAGHLPSQGGGGANVASPAHGVPVSSTPSSHTFIHVAVLLGRVIRLLHCSSAQAVRQAAQRYVSPLVL